MSNHHPGNEWYRRLIRSNRPLYRACPKHTKLLVSKAIVQAVEQQGGRFLEHDKKSGLWYVVPYKRAVDKTSQGLRERDRENDDDDGREMDPAHVPESFQGRHNAGPTNLNDLAAVAVAHANGNQAYSQWHQGTVAPMNASKRPLGDNAPSTSYGNNKRVRMDVFPTPVVSEVPQPTTLEARQSSIFRLMKQTQWLSGIKGGWAGESSTPAASPGSMPAPQVSTNPYPTKLNNLSMVQKGRVDAEPAVAYHTTSQPELTELSISASLFTPSMFLESPPSQSMVGPASARGGNGHNSPVPAPPLARLTTQISDWLFSFWPLQGKAEAERTGRAGYPSDPLDGDPFESESPDPSERQVREQKLNFQSTAPASILNSRVPSASEPQSLFLRDTGGRTMPFPNSRLPPSIQQQIKIPAPFNLDEQKPVITTVPPPVRTGGVAQAHPSSANRIDKRKHRSSFPALPYDQEFKVFEPNLGGTQDGVVRMSAGAIPQTPTTPPTNAMYASNPPVAHPPAPQLEPSISTSLFKLASSPSRLLAGITSFFERPTTTGVGGASVPGNAASAEAGLGGISQGLPTFTSMGASMGAESSAPANLYSQTRQGSAMPRRASKSTKSLLDDDEDTPMEARLRTLPTP